MQTTTSFTATIDAGRQPKHTPSLTIDATDAITGLLRVQVANNKSASQSSVLEDTEAYVHPSALRNGWLAAAAVCKKWKRQIAKKISKDKRPPVLSADAEYMQKLLHRATFAIAVREANEKARQELKASLEGYCTPEQFELAFPPHLQYISKAWEEEISENVWKELVSGK